MNIRKADGGWRGWILGGALAIAAMLTILVAWRPDPEPEVPVPPSEIVEVQAEKSTEARTELSIDDLELDVPILEAGSEVGVLLEELPRDRPARFAVFIPVPSTDSEPRPVRLIASDSRTLKVWAPMVGAERMHATFEVHPGWLEPGRYIVEVKTTERTHFPLRRYVFNVR